MKCALNQAQILLFGDFIRNRYLEGNLHQMEPRRLVTAAQVGALLSYIEKHGDLVLGKDRDRSAASRVQLRRQWEECAAFINREGEPRTGKDWAKYWSELKSRVKAKLGTSSSLTPLEERVAVFVRQSGSADSTIQEKGNLSKEDEEDDSDDDVPLVISLTPHASPRPPPPAEPSPSPLPVTPPSSGSKGIGSRAKMSKTRATQYSPSIHMNSYLERTEERHARMEDRRARFEERRARLEERRAHTEQLMAEAVMQRTEAAVVQAEAARTQAHALTNISHALQQLVDAASLYLAQPNRF